MDSRLIDFVDQLETTATFEDAWDVTVGFFLDHGQISIDYSYCYVDHEHDKHNGIIHEFTRHSHESHPDWPQLQRTYIGDHLYDLDRCVQNAFVSVRPMLWSPEYMPREDGRLLGHYEGIREINDCCASICLPTRHTSDKQYIGMFHFGGAFGKAEYDRLIGNHGDLLWLGAMHADCVLMQHRDVGMREAVHLTMRERECLEWLSRGLKNDRIAERMAITVPTVAMHFANARRKLKVATREQALARAVLLRLVRP
jgi:DNA-binding CsgD family transcriptional regulator